MAVKKPITVADVLKATSEHFGIHQTDLVDSRNRTAPVVYARHIMQYLAKILTYKSFAVISRQLGAGDHTSPRIGFVKMSKAVFEGDTAVRADVKKLTDKLTG